jgi:hypothetical protein
MSWIYGRDDRLYLAKATDYKTIRNTGGAASVGAADACLHQSFTGNRSPNYLQPPDKESTATIGYKDRAIAGRFNSAPASIVTPMFVASAAGQQPDNGILFESAFGKVTAAGTVTYGPDGVKYVNETTPVAVEAWGFNTAPKRGRVAVGIVNRLVISAGADFATVSADLLAYAYLTQDRFAAASVAEKMGITAWPNEPGTQTYTGSEMTGFTGTVTLAGHVFSAVRNFTLTCNFNRQFRPGKFANDGSEYFPSEIVEGQPEFNLDIDLWSEAASADLDDVVAKIAARTAFDGTLVLGATAGGIYTFSLNNLIIPDGHEAEHADGDDRKVVSIRGLRAQITAAGTRDECNLVIS